MMLSVSLDDARVPEQLVDFVMYHELLHKKHGSLLVSGRWLAHMPAFRADEQLFADYSDARSHLNALAAASRPVRRPARDRDPRSG